MEEPHTRPHAHPHTTLELPEDSESTKCHCLPIHPVVTLKKPYFAPSHRRGLSVRPPSPTHPAPLSTQPSTISGVHENTPSTILTSDFSSLYDAISAHVRKFYLVREAELGATQSVIRHATTRLAIPWPQVPLILQDSKSRQGALFLCISWTILGRSLLLNLGDNDTPRCTFLPPKVVECFQTFCLGAGCIGLGSDRLEDHSVDFALLSEWRQISATLMYNTHVKDAFSCFDSRADNIERALNDLNTLLRLYADPLDTGHSEGTRLTDLRDVLRKGAKFAFTLFRQPSCWQFDWTPEHRRNDTDVNEQGRVERFESADTDVAVAASELVSWPTLLMVMDENDIKLHATDKRQEEAEKEGLVLGRRKYVGEFKGS